MIGGKEPGTRNCMIPNTYDTRVTSTEPGFGTGDTFVTYEDNYGNRYRKSFTRGSDVSISTSGYGSDSECSTNLITVTRSVEPEFKIDLRKYWRPPDPPRDPRKLYLVREDKRMKRVVMRPEFHARSNPRAR